MGAAALALVASGLSARELALGPERGHFQTSRSLRERLPVTARSGRCQVLAAAGTPELEARAVARDCEGHLRELERLFEVSSPGDVDVLLFDSAEQKGALMGASGTYVAKPWRREVYVQRAGFPHPVLRHELAHVVAGEFGQGPLRVSGPLGGLVPDPGRIEGVAVLAAPRDDGLSLREWAAAMARLDLLPPLTRLFQLSFLGEPSSRAYVVAGAFLDFLRQERGMAAVRAWYGGASLESASGGEGLAALEARFRAHLAGQELTPEALAAARGRFERPGVFDRRCPHVVDRLARDAGAALGAGDPSRAEALYAALLSLDPGDAGARLGQASAAERAGDVTGARERLHALATSAESPTAQRGRALEALGDHALVAGDAAEGLARYDAAAALQVDEDRLRTLDVKRWAFGSPAREVLAAHLVGDPRLGRDPTDAGAALGAWSEREPALGLADYLLARAAVSAGRWDLAARRLDRALARELPLPRVRREALRLRLVAACVLGERAALDAATADLVALPALRAGERADVLALAARCLANEGAPTGALPGTAGSAEPPAEPLAAPSASGHPAAARAGAPGAAAGAAPGGAPEGCPAGMLRIEGGETWIGSPRGVDVEDEWPRYRTRLAPFCLDRTEVTVGAYAECVAAGRCTAAGSDRVTCTAARGHGPTHPVNCVDHGQATAFCASRAARLPTEAEWEHAASGGDARPYSWGAGSPEGRACWKANGACPAGSFAPGAFGLVDMTGNLWEWTADWYGDYPYPPPEGASRVYRGGGWSRRFEKWMRVRLRNRLAPDESGSHLGFRCAAALPGAPCPFGEAAGGGCLHGVLDAECRPGRRWNGQRCAEPGEEGCLPGRVFVPGHGCRRGEPLEEPAATPEDPAATRRARTPEHDEDCREFQPTRPQAYRYEGSGHLGRNAAVKRDRCKNRDVGVGWNSACCP